MKKLNLTVLLAFVFAFANAQTVEMFYHFDTPTIHTIQGYEQIEMSGCMQSALPGQPSLPWQQVSLLLPEGQEATDIEVILSDFQELEGTHNLFPYQPARRYSAPERSTFFKDEALYQSKAPYPSNPEGHLSTQYLNGAGFAFSTFTPVQYEPATGRVRYATKAMVKVTTSASKADHSRKLWLTPNNRTHIAALAQNPEMLDQYQTRNRVIAGYDLLVITPEQWVSQFEPYAAFYQARGLRTQVTSLESIYSSMTGVDNQEKIRNYIIQEYENNGISMVNLGGSASLIPSRGFYCYVTSGGGNQQDGSIPADLYYAGLDGTWNDNGNNWWGEIGEDDLLPDIGVGRMCFNNQEQFDNMMHKIFTYQTSPVLGEFHKVIMGGEHLYDDPLSNGSQYLELLIGEHNDNGYYTDGIPENYDFTRLYDEEGNWSGDALKQAINQGTQYVHHDGHANSGYVAGWYNSTITDSNFSGANGINHNYTFFHTSGCDCGDFSSGCILERMTQISNFAVATIGNSRYGWFNEGQTEGPAIHLHRETEDAYYHERIPNTGLALSEAKRQTAPWVTAPGQWEEGALRWNFYDLNLMGDVAVSPWHDEPFTPEVNYEAEILVGLSSTNITVTDNNGSGLYNFRCALFHNQELIGVGYTDQDGNATIEFADPIDFVDEMSLIVTGCNAWPQTLEVISLPGNCAYVIYNTYEINDENGQADFGETIHLNMNFKNVGTLATNNITATLSTESEYVTITDNTATIASLNGNENISLDNAFTMVISDTVPDMTNAKFFVTCTDGTDTWTSKFNMKLHAPVLAFTGMDIDDSAGNNNGNVDAGETITVHFSIVNNGSSTAPDVHFEIYNNIPEIVLSQSTFELGNIEAGQSYICDFTFTLTENAEYGAAYQIPIALFTGDYVTHDDFFFTVGQVMEGFESGNLNSFEWNNNSPMPWYIVGDQHYEGHYCLKSGNIDNAEETTISITLTVYTPGEVSFYKKVSSEASYDKLIFYIDESEKGNWSGQIDWSLQTYPISTGNHTLRWTYHKDYSISSGNDCAWLDNIVFPPTHTITEVTESVNSITDVYPNPNNGTFTVDLPDEPCKVKVFNSVGQLMYCQENVQGTTTITLQNITNGMYFLHVSSASSNSVMKFVKE